MHYLSFLIIYFVNNFLIVHPYDVSAFILQCGEVKLKTLNEICSSYEWGDKISPM